MALPDFMIIGAAKSGTTSMHMYLGQHPEVFFPEFKEPNYFALTGETLPKKGPAPPKVIQALIYSRSITDFDRYESIFDGAGEGRKLGEASVRYLYFPKAAGRIREKVPDVRCVAILRDPVARLYSHYCMNVQYLIEPLSLRDALDQEEARIADGWGWDWHYAAVGSYADQVERYFETLGRDQVKVMLYDDFVADPQAAFAEVCRFVGIDDGFRPDMSKRGKVASRPRSKVLGRWLHWPGQGRQAMRRLAPWYFTDERLARLEDWNRSPVEKLDAATRRELGPRFRRDIEKLGRVLGRDIPWSY